MQRTFVLFILIFSYYEGMSQAEFLKEMDFHKNVFDQGFSEISTNYDDSKYLSSDDFDELMTYAIERQKIGDHSLAISLLKKARVLYEEHFGGLSKVHRSINQINPYPDYLTGLSYYCLYKIDSAIFHFKRAINNGVFFSEPYVELGNIFLEKEQFDSARFYYERGYKIDPTSAFLNHNLGLVYLREENASIAHKYFLKNIGINPKFQPSYVLAASIYESRGSFHMAEMFYSKAIILSETKADNLIARGYYYLRREEYDRALRDFQLAHDNVPLNSDVIWQLVLLELRSKNYIRGMNLISELSISKPIVMDKLRYKKMEYSDAEIVALLDLHEIGNFIDAEKILLGQLLSEVFFNKRNGTYQSANELIKIYPDSELINRVWLYSKSSIYLGAHYTSLQLTNNYIVKIDSVLDKFKRPEILLLKGSICHRYGDYSCTIDQMDEVINLDSSYAVAYYYKGEACMKLREYDSAIRAFSKAISLVPNYLKARNVRGNTYFKMSLYDNAIQDYREVLKSSEFHGWPYNDMGLCFKKLGLYDSALIYFNKSIEANNENAVGYTNRGDLFSEHNQYERALRDYNKALDLNRDYYLAREKRADLFFIHGEVKMAVNDYIKTLRFFQQEKFRMRDRGNAHLILKKYKKANNDLIGICGKDSIDFYKRLESEFVKEYSANYTDIGLIKYNRKEFERGREVLLIALEINSSNVEALGYLARMELFDKNWKKSKELYRQFKSRATEKEISNAVFLLEREKSDKEMEPHVKYILEEVLSVN
ncbi:MAG: tetratricopeptide repeat protein [Reichenbachiella sp.]|uniref:tetratricopeptide repeat protein n=1 Tax=Reichenbachiella sp. TaxID=2184521 RepID=UPI003262F7CA